MAMGWLRPAGAAVRETLRDEIHEVRRADLPDVLSRALLPGVLRLNGHCVGSEQDGEGVTVRLASGTIRSDVLIGADIVHFSVGN